MQEGDPAPKFDKKPKTDELMEAIRFKGRQGTAKAVRNTHMHTLVARIRRLLRSVLGKRECSKSVCGCRHGRGRRSMRWTRTKAAAAAALLPSPKKRSATAALPVSTAFFLRTTDWESLACLPQAVKPPWYPHKPPFKSKCVPKPALNFCRIPYIYLV